MRATTAALALSLALPLTAQAQGSNGSDATNHLPNVTRSPTSGASAVVPPSPGEMQPNDKQQAADTQQAAGQIGKPDSDTDTNDKSDTQDKPAPQVQSDQSSSVAVPRDQLPDGVDTSPDPSPDRRSRTQNSASRGAPQSDQQTLQMIPGVNQVVPISRGHLNRIITPFNDPEIHTTSDAKIKTAGNVIYVTSNNSAPVTMYVNRSGYQQKALSLTLLPKAIPPREVRLRLTDAQGRPQDNQINADRERAREWEHQRPYVKTIKKAMRQLAFGNVPPGYDMHAWQDGDPMVTCSQSSLSVTQGQVLEGSQFIIVVGLVENISQDRVSVNEHRCRQDGMLALSLWPKVVLEPSEDTEIYAVIRRPDPAEKTRDRPSLLRGANNGAKP